MAKSRYEYVKSFETMDSQLPNTYMVIRLDGRCFHKFTKDHEYNKPNDIRGLSLMNKCALKCMQEFPDCCFAYGESDEFSFVMKPDSTIFSRRKDKIISLFASLFSSSFVFHWKEYFKEKELLYTPIFDARMVIYPTFRIVKDYLAWRQVDCHINNLYNTCFWTLVLKGNYSNSDAEKLLCGTSSEDKNEILFTKYEINYNNEPDMFKKGSIICRKLVKFEQIDKRNGNVHIKEKKKLTISHEDIISDIFWNTNPHVLPDNTK